LASLLLLRHNNEIRPINNPTLASKCSSERKSHTSLTLNEKLEMIKFSKKGMPEADWLKARPLATYSQIVTAKEKFLKEIRSATQ